VRRQSIWARGNTPQHEAEYIDAIRHARHQSLSAPFPGQAHISFNGKLRDECLSLEWFRSRAEARIVIENWRRHYNAVRPHSSLQYLTPHEFKRQHQPSTHRAISQE
jgi:transposase InsO family protein